MNKVNEKTLLATSVNFEGGTVFLTLNDERVVGCPLSWFPRLEKGTDEQRNNWRLIAGGVGVHWENLDEDISVDGLFGFNGQISSDTKLINVITAMAAALASKSLTVAD